MIKLVELKIRMEVVREVDHGATMRLDKAVKSISEWKVKHSKRNRKRYRLRDEWYRLNGFSAPCRMCGNGNHTAMKWGTLVDDSNYNYNCPIARWEYWPNISTETDRQMEDCLEASPEKLAEHNGYNHMGIEDALMNFAKKGNGMNMEAAELDRFNTEY